jgi:hypothetical protein
VGIGRVETSAVDAGLMDDIAEIDLVIALEDSVLVLEAESPTARHMVSGEEAFDERVIEVA